MDAKESNDSNLRMGRLARAIWGQYGAVIMREWEEQGEGRRE